MVVEIPNGVGTGFIVIGLVEFLWNEISGIINRRIYYSIQFHDALHGFCAGRGTITSTLKARLLQHLISMRETFLYSIFLYLRKSYDALERDLCLDILEGYGLGPKMLRILWKYWDQLQMMEKVGGHYSPVFQSHRRVTQGDPLSPSVG